MVTLFSDPLDFIGERLSLCWLWLLVLQAFLLGKGCYCLVTPFCWILGGENVLLLGIFTVYSLNSWLGTGFCCF